MQLEIKLSPSPGRERVHALTPTGATTGIPVDKGMDNEGAGKILSPLGHLNWTSLTTDGPQERRLAEGTTAAARSLSRHNSRRSSVSGFLPVQAFWGHEVEEDEVCSRALAHVWMCLRAYACSCLCVFATPFCISWQIHGMCRHGSLWSECKADHFHTGMGLANTFYDSRVACLVRCIASVGATTCRP